LAGLEILLWVQNVKRMTLTRRAARGNWKRQDGVATFGVGECGLISLYFHRLHRFRGTKDEPNTRVLPERMYHHGRTSIWAFAKVFDDGTSATKTLQIAAPGISMQNVRLMKIFMLFEPIEEFTGVDREGTEPMTICCLWVVVLPDDCQEGDEASSDGRVGG
jgi:hypothetical protein